MFVFVQGHIYIHGNIGSYTDPGGKEVKGVELLDVIAQVKSQPNINHFLAHIGSPGGLVDAGNQIYDYFESLKAQGIRLDTISDSYIDSETGEMRSGVGSIATKPFLSGQTRTIIDGHEFFIHNPWTQPKAGDSVQINAELQALKQTEAELRAFYQMHTKVTDAGLKGLMDNETGMNADMAVTLGFATRKASNTKIKAFAKLNTKPMAEKTFAEQIAALKTDILTAITGHKGQQAAPMPGMPENEPPEGDPTGLPDGEYPLADGRVIVISGGQVKEVKMPAAAAQPNPAPAAPAPAAQASAELQAKFDEQAKELAAMKEEQKKALAELAEFKNTLVSGKSPAKAINNNGGAGNDTTTKNRSIGDVLAAKKEERRKQLYTR